MACIILEKDDHSRKALQSLLIEFGYNPIYTTGNLRKFEHYLQKIDPEGSLIISGLDSELTKLAAESLAHRSNLFLVPMIQLINGWGWATPFLKRDSFDSRIDNWLARPLSPETLLGGIQLAQLQRAQKRSTLIVYSKREVENHKHLREIKTQHWQNIVVVHNNQLLFEEYYRHQQTVGAFLVEPRDLDIEAIDWLRRFKKTPIGLVTPIAALSRDPLWIQEVRTLCDVFFENASLQTLTALSKRSVYAWAARDIIRECRKSIRTGQLRMSTQLIKSGLKMDDRRFEYHELAGLIARQIGQTKLAIHHFKMALKDNPCSPFPYLNLIQLIQEKSERELIMKMGIGFCPAHPQLANLIKNQNERAIS